MIIGRALTNSYILRDNTYPYLSCALTVLVCSDKSKMLACWSFFFLTFQSQKGKFIMITTPLQAFLITEFKKVYFPLDFAQKLTLNSYSRLKCSKNLEVSSLHARFDLVPSPCSSSCTQEYEFLVSLVWSGSQQHFERQLCISKMGFFTVVYLVAKPLIWSEAEGDLVVIETSI